MFSECRTPRSCSTTRRAPLRRAAPTRRRRARARVALTGAPSALAGARLPRFRRRLPVHAFHGLQQGLGRRWRCVVFAQPRRPGVVVQDRRHAGIVSRDLIVRRMSSLAGTVAMTQASMGRADRKSRSAATRGRGARLALLRARPPAGLRAAPSGGAYTRKKALRRRAARCEGVRRLNCVEFCHASAVNRRWPRNRRWPQSDHATSAASATLFPVPVRACAGAPLQDPGGSLPGEAGIRRGALERPVFMWTASGFRQGSLPDKATTGRGGRAGSGGLYSGLIEYLARMRDQCAASGAPTPRRFTRLVGSGDTSSRAVPSLIW